MLERVIHGGHDSCVQDVKGYHMKEELDLLCGFPGALSPSVSLENMIETGISTIFHPVCRLGFRVRESVFYLVILQIGLGQACWIFNINWWGRERTRGLGGAEGWGNGPD